MDAIDIIKTITKSLKAKKNYLDLAIDRGLGKGMQIEDWILVEMLLNLIKLRDQDNLDEVEAEHKYPLKKGTRYEHCDLWWCVNNEEHWLEVKTIVMAKDKLKGSLKNVKQDIKKINRLDTNNIFHHLTMVFPIHINEINSWEIDLNTAYKEEGLQNGINWNYKIWDEKVLLIVLYSTNI